MKTRTDTKAGGSLPDNRYLHGMDGGMEEGCPADYQAAAAYIAELPRFTKKHSLEHTK